MKIEFFESAEESWPEDEAAILIEEWKNRPNYSAEEIQKNVLKSCEHMRNVFENDRFFFRFMGEINKHFPGLKK